MGDENIREIKIIKVPLDKPQTIVPVAFKALDVNSLGLAHLEVKQKLKPNPPTLKSVVPAPDDEEEDKPEPPKKTPAKKEIEKK